MDRGLLHDVGAYRSPLARLASDHLPLVGRFCWSTRDPRNARRFKRCALNEIAY